MLAGIITVSIALASVRFVSAGIDNTVCTPSTKPVFPPPPALTTTKLLSLRVEWRETLTKRTYNVLEYYDDERKLGALNIQMPPQQNVKIIFDNKNDAAIVVKLPSAQSDVSTCTVSNMGAQMFTFDNKPWLTSVMYLYKAMLNTMDAQFVPNSTVTTIRSYPVQEWSACMYDFYTDLTTKIQFFFSDTSVGWMAPHLPPNEPMLVSIMMHSKQQNSNKEFNVVGDITDFTPFPTFPEDAFYTPAGVYCPGRPPGMRLPMISDKFYMLMEVINLQSITFDEIWYDNKAQRIRHDTKMGYGNDPNPRSTIYNFATGVRYEKDLYIGSCNVGQIKAGDDYTAVDINNFVSIQNTAEIFHYNTNLIQYAGQMSVRGVLCDSWVGVYFDVSSNTNSTVQWYFTTRAWQEAVDTVVIRGAFFRMDLWQGGSRQAVIYNIHKYTPVTQHWSVFDYGSCYTTDHRLHFVIQLLALDNFTMDGISKPYLYDMLQEEFANLIFEETNRFSNILVEYDGGKYIYVSGLLLDKTPITNYNLAKHITQHPLTPTYTFLKGTVERNVDVLITNLQGDPVRLQTRRIELISFPSDDVTTHSTPTTIPTVPIRVTTLPPTARNFPTLTTSTPMLVTSFNRVTTTTRPTSQSATVSNNLDLATLTSHMLQLEQTVSSLQSQSQIVAQQHAMTLTTVLSELTDTKDELKEAKTALLSLRKDFKDLEAELSSVKIQLNKNENVSETSLESVKSDVASLETNQISFKRNITSLKVDIMQMKQHTDSGAQQLTSVIQEVNNLTNSCNSLHSELRATQSEVKLVSGKQTDLTSEVTDLQTSVDIIQTNLSDINVVSSKLSASQSHLSGGSAFEVIQSTQKGVTVGMGNRIKFDSVKYNSGSHYNNDTGTFTAPVSGTYLFWFGADGSGRGSVSLETTQGELGVGATNSQKSFTTVGFLQAGEQAWFKSSEESNFILNSFYGGAFLGSSLK